MPQLSTEEAIKEIKEGRMVILVDDEDRENEGDLCMAAEKVTPEAINFMAKYGRGLICHLSVDDRGQNRQLGTASDGGYQYISLWDRFYRIHRSSMWRDHWDFGRRPGYYDINGRSC